MDDDDDISWADPAIRRDYEAALGRLILVHNEVDYRLSKLIRLALGELGDPTQLSPLTDGDFARRTFHLEVLQALCPKTPLAKIDCAELRALNGERNVLAHGHFDQNPFDGSYTLIQKAKARAFPIERIDRFCKDLEEIAENMRFAETWFLFDDLDAPDETA